MSKTELMRSFDEVQFGPDRTLNLRDGLPTGSDARFRAEAWLRQRQAQGSADVLIITGRGKGSSQGIPVVRDEVLALLHALRRQGVVTEWREHTPGSIVVKPGRMMDLLTSPRRHRDAQKNKAEGVAHKDKLIAGLQPETEKLLRELAERTLVDLGMQDISDLIESEMAEKLSRLLVSVPESGDRETELRALIVRAIEEIDAG